MADTTMIRRDVEKAVRIWLSKKFGSVKFESEKLQISTGKECEFDAVSEDRGVVAAILSSRPRTIRGHVNTGFRRKAEVDFWRLVHIKDKSFKKRLMVFTDQGAVTEIQELLDKDRVESVEFCFCKLESELRKRLHRVLDDARREQKGKSR